MPTHFLQIAKVNKAAQLVDGDRWFTLASYEQDMAEYYCDRVAAKGANPSRRRG